MESLFSSSFYLYLYIALHQKTKGYAQNIVSSGVVGKVIIIQIIMILYSCEEDNIIVCVSGKWNGVPVVAVVGPLTRDHERIFIAPLFRACCYPHCFTLNVDVRKKGEKNKCSYTTSQNNLHVYLHKIYHKCMIFYCLLFLYVLCMWSVDYGAKKAFHKVMLKSISD